MHNLSRINKVAVLGAGVMGAQIAAHFVNAGLETRLFDLPATDGGKNKLVEAAIKRLHKIKPAPLASDELGAAIHPANYDDDLDQLRTCDLVIEAIGERMDWKQDLYRTVAPYIQPGTVLASNTSGLSLQALSEVLPAALRPYFCGIHFFNPPRYMHLVEVTPTADTDKDMLGMLEGFLTRFLGKGVVYARDTPNFIGNRIGVFSILSCMQHTQHFGLDFDTVDQLTGTRIGRPKSATYRTADVVGLDTLAHVVDNMAQTLPDDPWHACFAIPDWLQALIEKKALGQKSGAGIYRKQGKDIQVLDLDSMDYRPASGAIDADVEAVLKLTDPVQKMQQLRALEHPQAQFLWACWRDLFHYSAYHLEAIADSVRDVDLAMRWGYGWQQGPFETWQQADFKQVCQWLQDDIDAGKTLASAALPDWVQQQTEVYTRDGAFSPQAGHTVPRSSHPVYERQLFPQRVVAEPRRSTRTLWENDGMRLWTDADDGVGIISFKTKMHTINDDVLNGLQHAIGLAEDTLQALVIWQDGTPFSAGADLKGALRLLQDGAFDAFAAMIENFQKTSMRIKHAQIPVVAALNGLTLGGGCEFQMHSAHTVAAMESYIGLVEAGVGLLPSGGGLKELALRAGTAAFGNPFDNLRQAFTTTAMAKVSKSALDAKKLGLLRPGDTIVMHADEILHVAKSQALALVEANYRPPRLRTDIPVAGRPGTATFRAQLVNMLEGHFISAHDQRIATAIADTLCGGDIERDSLVDENWFLQLERQHFIELAKTEKTQARIAHTMQTGKPLRN